MSVCVRVYLSVSVLVSVAVHVFCKCMHLSEQACAFEDTFMRMCDCADVRVHV